MNMRNYDFEILRADRQSSVFTGCIARRFAAALFDSCFLLSVMIVLGFLLPEDADGVTTIPPLVGLGVLATYLFLPEYMYRQTLGMWIFGVVLICPANQAPEKAILIRRLLNLVEIGLPSAVYHFVTACSKDHKSLSDMASGCIVARKRYLKCAPANEIAYPSKAKSVLIALIFTVVPFILMVVLTLLLFLGCFALFGFTEILF